MPSSCKTRGSISKYLVCVLEMYRSRSVYLKIIVEKNNIICKTLSSDTFFLTTTDSSYLEELFR